MTPNSRWLDDDQQRSWRALIVGMTLLMDRLDYELSESHGLSMTEYEILVRLSESPDRRLRMAQLADSLAHSRSRVTHTVARMEKAGLVERCDSPDDGRGVLAALTERGWNVLAVASRTHVTGVNRHLVDLATPEDFAALGRVMNAVTDHLVDDKPGMDIRR